MANSATAPNTTSTVGNQAPAHVVGGGDYEGLFFIGFDNYRPGGILRTIVQESETIAKFLPV